MKESNKTKVVFIVAILVVVGIVLAKKLMGGNSALTDLGIFNSGSGDGGSGGSGVSVNSNQQVSANVFPLSYEKRSGYSGGSAATAVQQLQRWLNATAYAAGVQTPTDFGVLPHGTVSVDGKFGPLTKETLRRATGMESLPYTYYVTKQMWTK